jgi:hypothetical protein
VVLLNILDLHVVELFSFCSYYLLQHDLSGCLVLIDYEYRIYDRDKNWRQNILGLLYIGSFLKPLL